MTPFCAELIGTMLLILMGDGSSQCLFGKDKRKQFRMDCYHYGMGIGGFYRCGGCRTVQRRTFESCSVCRFGNRGIIPLEQCGRICFSSDAGCVIGRVVGLVGLQGPFRCDGKQGNQIGRILYECGNPAYPGKPFYGNRWDVCFDVCSILHHERGTEL